MLLPNVATSVIIMELRSRINDQLSDPEPQYDVVLSEMKHTELLMLDLALPILNPDIEEN